MCGRFVGYRDREALLVHFPIDRIEAEPSPSYNVAPSQSVPVLVRIGEENVLRAFQWGLVPFWAKDPSIGSRLINARSETAHAKPAFRTAFQRRRCLIPADGFYEWQGTRGRKQPVLITLPGSEPFGFAGLWEVWDAQGQAAAPLFTCTILTMEASAAIRDIHPRMPVILKPEAYQKWIDESTDLKTLRKILMSQVWKDFDARPVSKAVNNAANNSPDLIRKGAE
jgi:putative SOS response-associated peptidase YedK